MTFQEIQNLSPVLRDGQIRSIRSCGKNGGGSAALFLLKLLLLMIMMMPVVVVVVVVVFAIIVPRAHRVCYKSCSIVSFVTNSRGFKA